MRTRRSEVRTDRSNVLDFPFLHDLLVLKPMNEDGGVEDRRSHRDHGLPRSLTSSPGLVGEGRVEWPPHRSCRHLVTLSDHLLDDQWGDPVGIRSLIGTALAVLMTNCAGP